MADLRALIEFIVAIVSAYFLIKIENVKQQKDIATLQSRVDRLEQKQNEEIREIHGFIREIRDMIQELEDRYGKLPIQVKRLMSIAEIKQIAQKIRIKNITSSDKEVIISFDTDRTTIKPDVLINMVKSQNGLRLSPSANLILSTEGMGQDQLLQKIKNILQEIV